VVLDRLREVVEAVAAAEVRDRGAAHRLARAVHEAAHLAQELRVQVGAVAPDGRRGDVHTRVPVDLVQAQRRPLPEVAVDGRDDAVGDQVRGRGVQAERLARLPGEHQRPRDLGVDDQVLDAAVARDAVLPAGLVALGAAGGLGHPRRALAQRVDELHRAVVAAGRAGMARQRRGGVREQQVRAQHRALGGVGAPVPVAVELVLHPVGERPVGGVVERARIGGRGCGDHRARHQQACEHGTRAQHEAAPRGGGQWRSLSSSEGTPARSLRGDVEPPASPACLP
jgi:hypothetical protein